MKMGVAAGRLALVVGSTLLALGALEITLRLFGSPPPPPEDNLRTYTEYDPELGWRGRPRALGQYRTSRFVIDVALNSGGWRDEDPQQAEAAGAGGGKADGGSGAGASRGKADAAAGSVEAEGRTGAGASRGKAADAAAGAGEASARSGVGPSGGRAADAAGGDGEAEGGPGAGASGRTAAAAARPSIAVLGDSFAWGYGVSRGEMFAHRLEASLPGWKVQNYGVCGYGTDQELLVLRRSALAIRPRIVLVEFALGNDIDNILSAQAYHLPKPRFVLDEKGRLQLEGVPVPRVENWQRAARTGLRDFLTAHVRVYAWARPRWAGLRPRLGRLLALASRDKEEGVRLRLFEHTPSERVRGGWRLAEAILAAMRDDAQRAGARMVLLIVPDRLQVEPSLWEHAVEALHLDPKAYDLERPDRTLAEIGERLGVVVVDPLVALREATRAGQSVFIPDDPHWNAEGHGIAAEALARALAPLTVVGAARE